MIKGLKKRDGYTISNHTRYSVIFENYQKIKYFLTRWNILWMVGGWKRIEWIRRWCFLCFRSRSKWL